ncbi:MAG TPA: hypothetical protein VJ385_03210 [Fibrobacteria bacterium]|nr:hypothetical protein [Fibrobacteria bacterium]
MRPDTMRYGWAILLLAACVSKGHPLDVDVHFSESGGAARLRIFHVAAREPLGAVKLRLKLKPGMGTDAVTSLQPASGPWSQFLPQAKSAGGNVTVWAMAPNIGESRDSASRLIADLTLALAPGKTPAAAADLIDSVIVEEAWTPFGQKTALSRNLTTGMRPARDREAPVPVERIRGLTRSLTFTLAKAQRVRVYVSDFRGRRLADVLDRKLAPGLHEATWDGMARGGKPLAAGSYFLRLEAGTYAYDRKLEVAP